MDFDTTIQKVVDNNSSMFNTRFVDDRDHLKEIVKMCKQKGHRVVLTQGSFDMVHMGHARYLEMAKNRGDILVVGVDNDEKIRKRKGEHRPVVPEKERVTMLTHLKSVDFVTLKKKEDPRWFLIRKLKPDVLVMTERMKYSDEDLAKIKKLCGEIVLLKSQAVTSTSARVRLLHVGGAENITKKILERFPHLVSEIFDIFDKTHNEK